MRARRAEAERDAARALAQPSALAVDARGSRRSSASCEALDGGPVVADDPAAARALNRRA